MLKRDYLKKSLEAEYIVIEAADGVRAYEKVVQDLRKIQLKAKSDVKTLRGKAVESNTADV